MRSINWKLIANYTSKMIYLELSKNFIYDFEYQYHQHPQPQNRIDLQHLLTKINKLSCYFVANDYITYMKI